MSRLYTMPCGVQTYYKERRRHVWIVVTEVGSEEFGEDYARACDRCVALGHRCRLALALR